MVKQSNAWMAMPKNKWPLMLVLLFSLPTVMVILIRFTSDSCATSTENFGAKDNQKQAQTHSTVQVGNVAPSPLEFMKSKLVLMVSHELSLSGFISNHLFSVRVLGQVWEKQIVNYILISSLKNVGGPLLLMELAFLLRGVGSDVVWITYQKPAEPTEVIYSLENKMSDRGVQVNFCFSFFL